MTEPNMLAGENLMQDTPETPRVTRLRSVTLGSIHADIRQELERHKRAMDELGTRLKNHVDEMLRANG